MPHSCKVFTLDIRDLQCPPFKQKHFQNALDAPINSETSRRKKNNCKLQGQKSGAFLCISIVAPWSKAPTSKHKTQIKQRGNYLNSPF